MPLQKKSTGLSINFLSYTLVKVSVLVLVKKKKNNIAGRSKIKKNTLRQTPKVGVKPNVYQGSEIHALPTAPRTALTVGRTGL